MRLNKKANKMDAKHLLKQSKTNLVEIAKQRGFDHTGTKEQIVGFLVGKGEIIHTISAACETIDSSKLKEASSTFFKEAFDAIKERSIRKNKPILTNELCQWFIKQVLLATDIDLDRLQAFFTEQKLSKDRLFQQSTEHLKKIASRYESARGKPPPTKKVHIIAYILDEYDCLKTMETLLKTRSVDELKNIIVNVFSKDPASVVENDDANAMKKWIIIESIGQCENRVDQIDSLLKVSDIVKVMETKKTIDLEVIRQSIGTKYDSLIRDAIENVKKEHTDKVDRIVADPDVLYQTMERLTNKTFAKQFYSLPKDDVLSRLTDAFDTMLQDMLSSVMDENPSVQTKRTILELFQKKYPDKIIRTTKVQAILPRLIEERKRAGLIVKKAPLSEKKKKSSQPPDIEKMTANVKMWSERKKTSLTDEDILTKIKKLSPTISDTDVQTILTNLNEAFRKEVRSFAVQNIKGTTKEDMKKVAKRFPFLRNRTIKEILESFIPAVDEDEDDGTVSPFHVDSLVDPVDPQELEKAILKVFSVYDVNPDLLPKTWLNVKTK